MDGVDLKVLSLIKLSGPIEWAGLKGSVYLMCCRWFEQIISLQMMPRRFQITYEC